MDAITRLVEFRASADARTLAGTAINYGDVSAVHRERFMPGALAPVPDSVQLNLMHDGGTPVGTAFLVDGPERLEFRAAVRPDSAAARLVQQGLCRAASIEFLADRERREGTLRVIESARILGIALVSRPSYPRSRVELRAGADDGAPPIWLL